MAKKRLYLVLGLATAAILAASGLSGGGKDVAKYKTAAVTRGDVEAVVSSTGTLNPAILVDVGAEVSGQVVKVNSDFNAPVRKGDVLAELDRRPFKDALEQDEANLKIALAARDKAKVDLDIAKNKYDRALDLFKKKLIAQEELDGDEEAYLEARDDVRVAEAGVKEAAAEVESSRIDLARTVIRSPIDGVVVTRNVTAGQTVAARFEAPVLFTIANDFSKMRLECDVDEAVVGRVKEGQRVEFTVEAFPADTFGGRVVQVRDDAEVDADVIRYPAICEVDNIQSKLRPGMTATVMIHTGEARGVLRVPNAALQFVPPVLTDAMAEFIRNAGRGLKTGQTPAIVWTVDKKRNLTPVAVTVGLAGPDFTEIKEGPLKEGQTVVIRAESNI